jgi:hypothetical protein
MNHDYPMNHGQRGAALVTSLVLLTIVTLLAITSMSTNTLEEKMAANSQEMNRAFQTAEAGIAKLLGDDAAFNTTNSVDDNGTPFNPADDIYDFITEDYVIGTQGTIDYSAEYRQKTVPKRGTGWDTTMAFYHFDLSSNAITTSGVSARHHAGAYQVGKK